MFPQHYTNVGNQQSISYIGPTFNLSSQSAECRDFCLGGGKVNGDRAIAVPVAEVKVWFLYNWPCILGVKIENGWGISSTVGFWPPALHFTLYIYIIGYNWIELL